MRSYLSSLACLLLLSITQVTYAEPQPEWAERLGVTLSPISPAFLKYLVARNSANIAQSSTKLGGDTHHLGYVPPPYAFPANMGLPLSAKVASASDSLLPGRFDLRSSTPPGVTPVRDQYKCGSCWTFGTMGPIESYLLYKKKKTTNYSEEDLNLENGFDVGPCMGGDYNMSAAYLTRWSGPVSERDRPYAYWLAEGGITSPSPLDETTQAMPPSSAIHIQKVRFLTPSQQPMTVTDRNVIKRTVMKDGAVGVAFFFGPEFYNSSTSAFYNNQNTDANHAVTLVGWDDSFPRSAFNNAPPMDGAFIIKNSWGTNWGDEGYFYLSYFDKSLQAATQFLEPEPKSNYTRIYEYDPLGLVNTLGVNGASDPETGWMSNIFMASANATKIKALGFYAVVPNTQYTIQVRTEVTVGHGYADPVSGKLVGETHGTLTDAGFNTVKLPSVTRITANRPFSVVVRLHTPGNQQPIPIEAAVAGYSASAASAPGQSYISPDGLKWQGSDTAFNVNLKAFAVK